MGFAMRVKRTRIRVMILVDEQSICIYLEVLKANIACKLNRLGL